MNEGVVPPGAGNAARRAEVLLVEPDIHYVDTRRVEPFGVSGVYVIARDGITLVETGTSLSAPYLLQAVRDLGAREEDIRRVVVTHIHLDHAGAAGWLVRRMPWLQVYVHERGVAHLEDPARLLESAEMVYGTREAVLALHGEILPVPAENLVAVREGEIEAAGGPALRVFDAAGHSSHHLGLFDPASGCLFSGEALGHYYPEADSLTPAVAPPSFDLEAARATAKRIESFHPRTICYSQFGPHRDPGFVIRESGRQLEYCRERIEAKLKEGAGAESVIEEILNEPPPGLAKGENLTWSMVRSIVIGFEIYLRRRGEIP